jgi:murein DD-endopeptidase MepM/ murein hydrolase activator NlpD
VSGSRAGAGLRRRGSISILALAALLVCFATPASALTGGAPTPSGSAPPPPSHSGTPDPAPSAGTLTLLSATTRPRRSFFYGTRSPRLRYEIGSDEPSNDLRIDVVDAGGNVIKAFYRNDVAPETPDSVRWDGAAGDGRPAENGHYSFRIAPQDGGHVARRASSSSSTEPLNLGFDLYAYAFPILGPHDYGGAAGRFDAARAGHTHEGQDVMAKCGTPLIAARGGRVQYSGYQAAAGNYLVIDGKGTGYDFAYMHLLEPSPLQEGATVRTGEPIGVVGQTGDATACHLHFEIWTAPGWYEGGNPIDPLPFLQQWDAYS